MKQTIERRLNHALDSRVTWGLSWRGRTLPAFQFWAGLGLALSTAAALALAAVRGLSPLWMTAAMAAAGFTCFVLALGYKVAVGEERLVFLHHVAAAMGAAVITLRLAGEPVLPYVEILAVCFGVLLATGRLGCLCAGCCHGRPHDWGVRYGEVHVEEGFPASLKGVRLVPVQLIESAWTGLSALACLIALAAGAPAGLTLACFLPLYAVGRFGCELLRGDAVRTWRGPLTEAQWICIGLVAASLIFQATGALASNLLSAALAASALAILFIALVSSRLRETIQPFHPNEVDGIADAVRFESSHDEIVIRATRQGWQVSCGRIESETGRCLHWAISGFPPEPRRLGPLARLLLRLEGLPGDTPVQVATGGAAIHILAFPVQEEAP